ncbi:MAG: hypothetical protein U9N42_06525 [Campylobacterota bacterium]|nr:hypothetical protein [Campylobacterota bacterium]
MKYLIIIYILLSPLFGGSASQLAKKYNLYAGTKASIQWVRVFSSERRMKKLNINNLSTQEKNRLQTYLISHAADSEQPVVPGL